MPINSKLNYHPQLSVAGRFASMHDRSLQHTPSLTRALNTHIPHLSKESKHEFELMFKAMDEDGSGALGLGELVHAFEKLGLQVKASELKKVLENFNIRNARKVRCEDFVRMMSEALLEEDTARPKMTVESAHVCLADAAAAFRRRNLMEAVMHGGQERKSIADQHKELLGVAKAGIRDLEAIDRYHAATDKVRESPEFLEHRAAEKAAERAAEARAYKKKLHNMAPKVNTHVSGEKDLFDKKHPNAWSKFSHLSSATTAHMGRHHPSPSKAGSSAGGSSAGADSSRPRSRAGTVLAGGGYRSPPPATPQRAAPVPQPAVSFSPPPPRSPARWGSQRTCGSAVLTFTQQQRQSLAFSDAARLSFHLTDPAGPAAAAVGTPDLLRISLPAIGSNGMAAAPFNPRALSRDWLSIQGRGHSRDAAQTFV